MTFALLYAGHFLLNKTNTYDIINVLHKFNNILLTKFVFLFGKNTGSFSHTSLWVRICVATNEGYVFFMRSNSLLHIFCF